MTTVFSYPSITRSEKVRTDRLGSGAECCWFVFEKIHGSNVGLVVQQEQPGTEPTVSLQTRNVLLPDESDFNSLRASGCFEKCRQAALKVWELVRQSTPQLGQPISAVVYGEVFGGYYQNTKCPFRHVQKGVSYTTEIEFLAFDILLCFESEPTMKFMDVEAMMAVCKAAGMPFVPLLAKFTNLNDALEYPVGFDSTIPAFLGLTPPKAGTNVAEGVVIRPEKELMFKNCERLILKKKVANFEEVEPKEAKIVAPEVSEARAQSDALINFAVRYINTQRLASVISKKTIPGAIYSLTDPKDRIITSFRLECVKDLIEDALRDIIDDIGDEPNLSNADPSLIKTNKMILSRMTNKAHLIISEWIKETMNLS